MMARDHEQRTWVPRTELGRKVAAKEITDIEKKFAKIVSLAPEVW